MQNTATNEYLSFENPRLYFERWPITDSQKWFFKDTGSASFQITNLQYNYFVEWKDNNGGVPVANPANTGSDSQKRTYDGNYLKNKATVSFLTFRAYDNRPILSRTSLKWNMTLA